MVNCWHRTYLPKHQSSSIFEHFFLLMRDFLRVRVYLILMGFYELLSYDNFVVKFCETTKIILIRLLKGFDPIIYGRLGVFCSKTNPCNLHSIDKIKGINQNKLAQKTGLNHNSSYHIGDI